MTETARPPAAYRRHRRDRPKLIIVWTVAVLLVLLLAAYGLTRFYSEEIISRVQTELSAVFGREVIIRGGRITRMLRIEELLVAGDGQIDTGPVMRMEGLQVWPSYPSLFMGKIKINLITVDTVVISAKYDKDRGWSLAGLFPKRPPQKSNLRRLEMPNTWIELTANGRTMIRRTEIAMSFEDYGEYQLLFSDTESKGAISYTGAKADAPAYSLNVFFDSVAIMGTPEKVELATTYYEDSKVVTFDFGSAVRGTPLRLTGLFFFDSTMVRSDSAAWRYGDYEGQLSAKVDDFKKMRVTLASNGTIPFDAGRLGKEFTGDGKLFIDRIFLQGGLEGSWDLRGEFRTENLTGGLSKDVAFKNLTATAVLSAALSENFHFTPASAKGTARFEQLSAGEEIFRNGDLKFNVSGEKAVLSGKIKGFGGDISSSGLQLALDEGMKPTGMTGDIRLSEIQMNNVKISDAVIRTVTARLDRLAIKRFGDSWKPQLLKGDIDRISGSYADAPLEISRASIDIGFLDNRASGRFDGRLTAFGGSGQINTMIQSGEIKSAKIIAFKGLDVSALRRIKDNDFMRTVSSHIETLDVDGEASVLENNVLQFAGTLGSPNFHLKPGTRKMAGSLAITATAPIDTMENVHIQGATLLLEGKSKMSIPPTSVVSGDFMTPITVDPLDIEHARDLLVAIHPIPGIEKIVVEGGMKGRIELVKKGDEWVSEIDLAGDGLLRGEPLEFTAQGRLAEEEPRLILGVKTVSAAALHGTLADLNEAMDRNAMVWRGSAGANMTIIGSNWSDTGLNIEGILRMKDASVEFTEYKMNVKGISGEIPFRLRKAQILELDPVEARGITIRTLEWKDLIARSITARSRFTVHKERSEEKSIYFDDITFQFADGKGAGFGALYFPTWDHPKAAFGAKVEGCSVGIVYRTMQPFKGVLEGRADAKMEVVTDKGEIDKFTADITIRDGILGSELLEEFIQTKQRAEAQPSLYMSALAELAEWNFKEAKISLRWDNNFYSSEVARAKGLDYRKLYEIVGDIEIAGPIRPFDAFAVVGRIKPLNFISVLFKLQFEKMPLRLFMYRVGRRTAAADTNGEPPSE